MHLLSVALTLALQAAPVPPVDSAQIHRAAQAAQARFERRRLAFLPWYDGTSWDPCDETIGRYCFRYGDRHEIWEPPPDAELVVRYRDQLIDELSQAARTLPGDEWIAGQRVRYLVEASRAGEAETAASECRAASHWWCLALAGYVQHGAGRYLSADSTYAAALGQMPRDERCRWTDLSLLLDGSPAAYGRWSCEARDSVERWFWWLADPLYLIPGNERRTEHYSRWVMNRLQDGAVSPWGNSWGSDHREILIRFGWPAGWARPRPGNTVGEAWAISANFREPLRAFEPPSRYLAQPNAITPGSLTLVPGRPRGGYVPAYAARVDSFTSQIAVFRRGNDVIVVAKYDLSQDSVAPETPTRVALTISSGPPPAGLHRASDDHASARGAISLEAPAVSGLLSLEALAPSARRAGRERRWLALTPIRPDHPTVSDPLLLYRADTLPRSLQEAIPLARESNIVPRGVVGLYWEVYGLGPGRTPYSVAITVVRESIGFLARAARAVGLGGRDRPQVRLGWDEASPVGDVASGAMALDLSQAKPGRYTIRLSITARGDSSVTERAFVIADPRP